MSVVALLGLCAVPGASVLDGLEAAGWFLGVLAGAPDSAKTGQQDGQVFDVHCGVVRKVALAPRCAATAEIGQQDRKIRDIHFAVKVGVTREAK